MAHQSSTTRSDLERMLFDETAEPKALPLSLMAEITNGFSDKQKIGEGGFAVVYQGMLQNGKVAVKRLSNTHMYEKEFHREVECLMMVKHKNVVRFLGYCADTQGSMERYNGKFVMADVQQRLLCFEYLPNGSLDKYITDTSGRVQWRNCFQIIEGICQGLHYLHQKKILHLDLKPANILLDGNLVPKIADFGVSRCFNEMQSRAITVNIAGTLGYLAPEFCNGEITYQFDIYSLGVIIIEILTGKKGYHAVDIVVESWSKKVEKSQSDVQLKQVRICAEIGIECTDFNPAKRPGTKNIIDRLVSLNETESMDGYIETSAITSQQAENAPNELHQARPKVPGEISYEDSSFHRSSNLLLDQTQPGVHCIGVCYGVVGNNLPPANEVVQLYKSKGITGMRIYFADAKALSALRNSGIALILDVGGDDVLANLTSSTSNAASWVQNNVRPYYPAVNIKYIAAGNEVQGGATQNIVPAMRNLNAALSAAGLGAIKVSTSIRFDAVANSFPPSAGVFAQSYMTDVARLLASTGAPLLTNVYPYFAYRGNPGSISLNYATFQLGTSVRDQINGLTYTCLFDAMVDAVYAALEKAGAPGVKVVVSETGWPSAGGFAASADNARTYNQGLINHVGKGTPKKPSALETYIFAMFNENQKNGDPTELHFGLFDPNKSPTYAITF